MDKSLTGSRLIAQDAVPMDIRRLATSYQPDNAIIFELGIEARPGNKDIMLNYKAVKVINGITNHNNFLSKMKILINNDFGNIGNKPVKRDRDNNAGNNNNRTKDTRLSIQWPVDQLKYVVIKLDYDRNWQFASDGNSHPFMIHKSDQGEDRFFDAIRFSELGEPVASGEQKDGCKFAAFIVNGVKLAKDTSNHFQHRFNILVDILEMSGSQIDNRIPIIIDPDVRNPGGGGS